MKDLGKTRILGIKLYNDRLRRLIEVMPKYIDEILNWFNIETPRRDSCRMEEVEARLGVSQTLDEQNARMIYQSCTPCYVHKPDMSYAIKSYEHIPECSLDKSKYIF